jgi:hypothetical protein
MVHVAPQSDLHLRTRALYMQLFPVQSRLMTLIRTQIFTEQVPETEVPNCWLSGLED